MLHAALLLLLATQVTPPLVPAPDESTETVPARRSPIDWDSLDALPFRLQPQVTPAMAEFVRYELTRGHCVTPLRVAGRRRVRADVAVLLGPEATIRAAIPRAIDCPTVEQYAAGLVLGFARNNLNPRFALEGSWYRASMTFDLPG